MLFAVLTSILKIYSTGISTVSKATCIDQPPTEKLINGEKIDIESSGLSKREWNELMTSFNLKDKIV